MTVVAQDYMSEVLYPDDLIPVEDLEGKNDYFLLFSNLFLDVQVPSPLPTPPPTTTTTTTMTEEDEDDQGNF